MDKENKSLEIVKIFLAESMKPDPVAAAAYMSDDVKITFTGNRAMSNAQEITDFNGGRYSTVKKLLGEFDCVEHTDHTVVYSNGTLYGEWPDGRKFSNNRYLDRFEVKNGKIVRMDVWNDSAEWILAPSINQGSE